MSEVLLLSVLQLQGATVPCRGAGYGLTVQREVVGVVMVMSGDHGSVSESPVVSGVLLGFCLSLDGDSVFFVEALT